MKLSEMKDLTASDSVSRKDNVITFRRGFFYTHGQTSEGFAKRIALALPDAEIIEHGEHWAPFNGGASVARSSHWWVKVRMKTVGGRSMAEVNVAASEAARMLTQYFEEIGSSDVSCAVASAATKLGLEVQKLPMGEFQLLQAAVQKFIREVA